MVYAKIIPPERAYCPDIDEYFGDIADEIVIGGNRNFKGHNQSLIESAERLCEDMEYNDSDYDDCIEKKRDGEYFAQEEWERLKAIATQPNKRWGEIEAEFVLEYLSIFYGKPYKQEVLHGCVQREWNDVYMPSDWEYDMVYAIESVYFNLGTEVAISHLDKAPSDDEQIEDIGDYFSYYAAYTAGDLKKEIAESEGVDPSEVVLYEIERYIKKPVYRLAE